MKQTRPYLYILFLLVSLVLSQQIISKSRVHQVKKHDLAELNNIKYGLFSINEWKNQISEIVEAEIGNMNLNETKNLKPMVEAQLHSLIDTVDKRMREKNNKTFKGRFKQSLIHTFVDIKDIKEGVPKYADEIIKVMEKPKNKRKLKEALIDKVDEYFDKTFEEQDNTQVDKIIKKTSTQDTIEARTILEYEITNTQKLLEMLSQILMLIAICAFVIAGISKDALPSKEYIVLVSLLFVLLLTGVMTPMIDLEAKISEMSFVLFDHQVKFTNQVLYFQTKSVIDVFWIMFRHPDFEMKIVGILMVMFSVVFPITKLISSIAYYYNPWNTRENKWVQFFVLKSGKWSMTDVMIIAIFMAYIGFNGVMESQLGVLHEASEELVMLTTNGTKLQFGFYVFMTYAVLAMFLSEFLTKRQAYQAALQPK